jgi:hypothetical protein
MIQTRGSVPRDKGILGTQPSHQLRTRLGKGLGPAHLSTFCPSTDYPQVWAPEPATCHFRPQVRFLQAPGSDAAMWQAFVCC